MKFKNIPNDDKPRERLLKYGVNNLSNEELLSIILRTGTKKHNVKELNLNAEDEWEEVRKAMDEHFPKNPTVTRWNIYNHCRGFIPVESVY
jgi:DNA repair protein RadC